MDKDVKVVEQSKIGWTGPNEDGEGPRCELCGEWLIDETYDMICGFCLEEDGLGPDAGTRLDRRRRA
jgi:hypothetical protein